MPTFDEERYRLHKEVQAIRSIIWNEWKRTAIGRFLWHKLRRQKSYTEVIKAQKGLVAFYELGDGTHDGGKEN